MITLAQQGTWLSADTQTPVSLYLALEREERGFLLESTEVDGLLGRYSLIGWDYRLILSCADGKLLVQSRDPRLDSLEQFSGLDYIDGLRACLNDLTVVGPENLGRLPAVTRSVCGYMGYNMGGIFEPALADRLPPEKGRSTLVLPGKIILFDHLRHRCCRLSLDPWDDPGGRRQSDVPDRPVTGTITATPNHEEFLRRVKRAKELITAGEAIQIVLSTRFQAPFTGSPFEVYRRLRQINPSPYTFFMAFDDLTLTGSSPEPLIRCEDGHLQLRPIAGTRARGATEDKDRELAEELLADEKERAEHVMLVDLGRNDLGRIAAPGSVRIDKYMQVERFSHVMHLTSSLSARLADGLDAIDVLRAGFPAGTVSGAPKIRAMQIIADEEKLDRGPYAGSIGWIGLDRGRVDLDMGITIRSLWIEDGQIFWQAGAGLVFDSDPESEWKECHNKAGAILKAITSTGGGDDFTDR